jgi:hypothetical protein
MKLMQIVKTTAKEVVRDVITRLELHGILDRMRKARGICVDHLYSQSVALRFTGIYDTKAWTHGDAGTPLSGTGSSLQATTVIRENLPRILQDINARCLIDIGCGDLVWMSTVHLSVDYVGVDVVPSVIRQNTEKYASDTRRFVCLDALVDDLPDGDTVLCREILFHLSFSDIGKLLGNLRRKPRRWLIATTDESTWFNADIRSGDYRVLNLRKRPIRFPKPAFVIEDSHLMEGRGLAVWEFDKCASEFRL